MERGLSLQTISLLQPMICSPGCSHALKQSRAAPSARSTSPMSALSDPRWFKADGDEPTGHCREMKASPKTGDRRRNLPSMPGHTGLPGLLATSGVQLSQRGKRILGHELAGLIERALN